MAPAPENQGTMVMAAYHPAGLLLKSQPKPTSGGKLTSLDQAVPGLRLPLTVTADQLVGLNIAYTYDALGRLTKADYSDGTFFHYTYDAVGNRLTQTTQLGTVNYVYTNNKLSSMTNTGDNLEIFYQYNGLGARVSQTVNSVTTHFVLDQAARLTQVLSDGTNTYLYGDDRIAQQSVSETEYLLTATFVDCYCRSASISLRLLRLRSAMRPKGRGVRRLAMTQAFYKGAIFIVLIFM